jgi:hypothetical protein
MPVVFTLSAFFCCNIQFAAAVATYNSLLLWQYTIRCCCGNKFNPVNPGSQSFTISQKRLHWQRLAPIFFVCSLKYMSQTLRYKSTLIFISVIMLLSRTLDCSELIQVFVAGRVQSETDQPNNLAEGQTPL